MSEPPDATPSRCAELVPRVWAASSAAIEGLELARPNTTLPLSKAQQREAPKAQQREATQSQGTGRRRASDLRERASGRAPVGR